MTSIFDPIAFGAISCPNRIVMAPLTRNRATMPGRVPNPLMRDYYVQRAAAGLILSEAVSVDPQGVGYPSTPGCWSDEQTRGWTDVVSGVHAAGGRIMMQLWHVGRISDPQYHDGKPPVAPSAIAAEGHVSLLRPKRPFPMPRALETDEIPGIVAAYKRGAANAKKAGFDGVEIHGANGYLLDQFLQDSTNKRTDRYGGSIENRARLMLEVADACIEVWGADRVGMHLAPRCDAHSMGDSDSAKTFGYVASELGKRKIAFIFARESLKEPRLGPQLRKAFGGPWIANEALTRETAIQVLADNEADAVSFGKDFISNPDLVERLKKNAAITPWNMATFYSEGPAGYTDYPTLAAAQV
ncbi:MAG: alkene reductase [Rhodoblastus sp.]